MISKNRYDFGEVKINHRGRVSNTLVGNIRYDSFVSNMEGAFSYRIGFIPAGYEHRPDLISNVFFGTPSYWWLLMLVNGITDPFEEFNANDRILVPIL